MYSSIKQKLATNSRTPRRNVKCKPLRAKELLDEADPSDGIDEQYVQSLEMKVRKLESELESVGAKYREQKLNEREKDIKL